MSRKGAFQVGCNDGVFDLFTGWEAVQTMPKM